MATQDKKMQIKCVRAFRGEDGKTVHVGKTVTVSRSLGRQLLNGGKAVPAEARERSARETGEGGRGRQSADK